MPDETRATDPFASWTKGWTHPSEVAHLDQGRPRALWERLATRANYEGAAAAINAASPAASRNETPVRSESVPEDAFKAWEAEQRELNQALIDNPDPNDLIERRGELRDSGMDEDQLDSVIRREYPVGESLSWAELDRKLDQEERGREPKMTDQEWASHVEKLDRQHEKPERSEWYRQSQEEHKLDLGAPQRFPLIGDGLVTQRVIAADLSTVLDIGAELALARYRDYQHAEKIIPTQQGEEKLQSWLQALLNKAPEQKRDAQPLLSETRNQDIEEQTRKRSLSL